MTFAPLYFHFYCFWQKIYCHVYLCSSVDTVPLFSGYLWDFLFITGFEIYDFDLSCIESFMCLIAKVFPLPPPSSFLGDSNYMYILQLKVLLQWTESFFLFCPQERVFYSVFILIIFLAVYSSSLIISSIIFIVLFIPDAVVFISTTLIWVLLI